MREQETNAQANEGRSKKEKKKKKMAVENFAGGDFKGVPLSPREIFIG